MLEVAVGYRLGVPLLDWPKAKERVLVAFGCGAILSLVGLVEPLDGLVLDVLRVLAAIWLVASAAVLAVAFAQHWRADQATAWGRSAPADADRSPG